MNGFLIGNQSNKSFVSDYTIKSSVTKMLQILNQNQNRTLTDVELHFFDRLRLLVLRTITSASWAIAWNTVSPWYVELLGASIRSPLVKGDFCWWILFSKIFLVLLFFLNIIREDFGKILKGLSTSYRTRSKGIVKKDSPQTFCQGVLA